LGIGFNNLNYAFDMETGMPIGGARAMPLDVDGNGRAEPEEVLDTKELAVNAVASGRYPSPPARDLNLVTLGQPLGLVRTFIEWVLTNGQDYVGEAGYIALPEVRLGEELGKLD
jgi:phosphate transport system substrate-binding protein